MRQTKTQKNLRPRTWDGGHSKSEAVVAREKNTSPLELQLTPTSRREIEIGVGQDY